MLGLGTGEHAAPLICSSQQKLKPDQGMVTKEEEQSPPILKAKAGLAVSSDKARVCWAPVRWAPVALGSCALGSCVLGSCALGSSEEEAAGLE